MSKAFLLSICIPTYNRAEILRLTLNNLITNPDYDSDLVEIVVSDNFSSDDTQKVVQQFSEVKYFKQETNIGDENFYKALSYGNGLYLKLSNDTVFFKEGQLAKIISVLRNFSRENRHLMFYQNSRFISNSNLSISSRSEFLDIFSYNSTWIANFGCWKRDFLLLNNPLQFATLNFSQVDWTYSLVGNSRHTDIYVDDYYTVQNVSKKGGYNILRVFGVNYFEILRHFNLSNRSLQKEKFRVL